MRALSLVLLLCTMLCLSADDASASAITAPYEARGMIEAAQATLDEKREKEENEAYKAEAEEYVVSTAAEAARAEADAAEARAALERAEIDARLKEEARRVAEKEAERSTREAAALAEKAQALFAQSAAAARRADSLAVAAQKRDAEVLAYAEEMRAPSILPHPPVSEDRKNRRYDDELLRMEAERKRLEEALKKSAEARQPTPRQTIRPAPRGGDWAAVRSAYARAAWLERAATAQDERGERAQLVADEKEAAFEEAQSLAEDAQLVLQDARDALSDYEAYSIEARTAAEQSQRDRDDLFAMLNRPPASRYASTAIRYHRWSDGGGRSGYQTAVPLSYGKWTPDFSYGIETYYVFTDELNTLTDTTLYFQKRDERKRFTFDYLLSINVPTGKSALNWSERHARWTEDLVTVDQFGKGWQFTPGLAVTWRTSEEETWTVGTSYTFSESYDPTSDIPNDDVSPGGEWGYFVRYINARDAWQLVLELSGSIFGKTKIQDGSSYTEGDSWDFRAAYNKKINEKQDIMFYYFLDRQGSNDFPFQSDNPNVHYFGTMWKNKLTPRTNLRLAFDVMTTGGNRSLRMYSYYDDLNNPAYGVEDVDGRTKYTLGVGYDWMLGADSRLALDVEYFRMEDGVTTLGYPSTAYNGWNVYLTYFMTF